MACDTSKLSPEALELIKLTGDGDGRRMDNLDVAALLQKRPELLKGMNEYLGWRDTANQMIAETKKSALFGHEMSKLITKLPKRGKRKKK